MHVWKASCGGVMLVVFWLQEVGITPFNGEYYITGNPYPPTITYQYYEIMVWVQPVNVRVFLEVTSPVNHRESACIKCHIPLLKCSKN